MKGGKEVEAESHDIPIELLYWQILTTVGPEFQVLSSVWESLDSKKRKTNSLIKKCVDRKMAADVVDNGRLQCIRGTCINHVVPIGGSQNNVE